MRGTVALACILGCVVATAASAAPDSSAFARLGWMEGRWTGVSGGVHMEEHWTSAAGNGLVGMHKDMKGGKMVSFEFFRIEPHPDGVFYMTSPGGAPATPFKLVEQSARRAVFENAAHDFPQRILYWSDRSDELCARVEGTVSGRAEAMEWRWRRMRR